MTDHYQPDEHDILFRLVVRRHHVGPVSPNTRHRLVKALKRFIGITGRGVWHVEVAEVASVTRVSGGRA